MKQPKRPWHPRDSSAQASTPGRPKAEPASPRPWQARSSERRKGSRPHHEAAPSEGEEGGGELIWGVHPVSEALRRSDGLVSEVLVQEGRGGSQMQQIIDLARQAKVRLRFVPRLPQGEASGQVHQGVLARISPVPLLSLEELLDRLPAAGDAPRLLAVDSVQDPRNLGAMLRAALASGIQGVILTRERCAPVGGTVVKTSAGAALGLPLCRVVNLAETLTRLKEQGYWIYGAVSDPAARSIYAVDFTGPVCLVIGNEGSGLRPLVARRCDQLVTIPMAAAFESLNSAMAAGVILFEIARRRAEAAAGPRTPAA